MKEASHWSTQHRILLVLRRGSKCVHSKSISSSDAVPHASQLLNQYFHSVQQDTPACKCASWCSMHEEKNQPLAFSQISPPTQTSRVDTLMQVWMHALNCTDPRHMTIISENSTGECFVYITVVLVQPVGWSAIVCLYIGADWLKLICQSQGGQRSADKAGKRNLPAASFPHGKSPAFWMHKQTRHTVKQCMARMRPLFPSRCRISPNWLAFNMKFSKNMANMMTWTPKSSCICLTALSFKCSLWWCLARTWSYGIQQP